MKAESPPGAPRSRRGSGRVKPGISFARWRSRGDAILRETRCGLEGSIDDAHDSNARSVTKIRRPRYRARLGTECFQAWFV